MPIELGEEKNYLFECWHCGEFVVFQVKQPKLRVFCEGCKEKYEEEKERTKKEYIALKIEVMYERALRILEKQHACLADYKESAETIIEFARQDNSKFESAPEMLAAMELIRNRIKIKMQYKINRHRIDILIPSMKVALEIDGYNHQFKVLKDSHRDVELINEFGEGWEVIRIPTKYIEANLKQLVPAIKELYKEKQKLRKANGGFIPKNFSKRDELLQEQYVEATKPFHK